MLYDELLAEGQSLQEFRKHLKIKDAETNLKNAKGEDIMLDLREREMVLEAFHARYGVRFSEI